jgi:uncharacterized membrane protein
MARWLSIPQWVIVAAMFVSGLAVWPLAPERIPIHWTLNGQVDRYAGKLEGLFLLPGITLLVLVGLKLLPRIDPNRARYVEFTSAYAIASLAIVAFLAAVHATVLASALGVAVNVGLVIGPLVGLLLIVLGAVMGDVRPNWFFGVRTPWTLSSERSWTATHRAARWVLLVMGLVIALAGVSQTEWSIYLAVSTCVVGVVGLVAYSFVVWRDDPQRHGVG